MQLVLSAWQGFSAPAWISWTGLIHSRNLGPAWHLHLRLGNMKDEQFIDLAKHLFRAENPNWMPWKAQIDEHTKLNLAKALKELRISENLSTDSDFLGDHANGSSTKPTESSTEVERLFGKSTDCPLWYAATFGLSSIMDSLITTNKDRINEQGTLKLTALAGACANGNLETIQILLDNHAVLNMPDTDGLSPLHSASRVGHNDVVKLLLTKCAKIEARVERMTPLHFAVLGGHLKTAQLLLDYNAEVEPQDSGGFTVIQGAVEFGHTELVKMLITRGANITTATNLELFQTACRKGFVEIVQILFDLGVDVNVSVSENHWTPLIWASRYGHVETVKFLIEKGANLEARGKDMVTPLYCAVTNGHIKAAQLLLDHNPDVDTRNIYDWTPLHSAVKEGYTELVTMLITKGANIATANENGVGPFYTACHEGFIEIARLLFDVGVDVNIPTQEDQCTPLIAASECGHVEIAKFLLENGANVEARNNEMMTPFYCAALNGHVKIIQLLFDHNADVNARQINNSTPVHAAVESGHIEVVKMLIAQGVNVNTADNSGIVPFYTACLEGSIEIARLLFDLGVDKNVSTPEDQWAPLNAASRRGHAEIVKFLLENGAEIDFPNKYQKTPLNLATFGGHLEVIKILVERGADVTKLDIWVWSLLNTAAECGHLEVVNMLLDDGADIESTNEDGMTPLHSACANGFTEIVKVLIEKDANYTAANNKGCTPIMTACSMGHVDVVKFLLDKGANFNLQGHDDPLLLMQLVTVAIWKLSSYFSDTVPISTS